MCEGTGIIEQRTYLKYCNGAETFYSYDPQRRRLQNLVVNAKLVLLWTMPTAMMP